MSCWGLALAQIATLTAAGGPLKPAFALNEVPFFVAGGPALTFLDSYQRNEELKDGPQRQQIPRRGFATTRNDKLYG
jgi:hypothetical protein